MKRIKMTLSDRDSIKSFDAENWNIPIYRAIKAYTCSDPLPFHMPGHKLGNGIPDALSRHMERLDLTEIPGTDNLHMPAGVIKEAQELASIAFGSQKTFFLVNGSTVGLHAAIAAVCRPGQKLIVGRDCHKAVINGMILSGVTPFYILPEYSEDFGISTGITASAVEKALGMNSDAAGVLITRPNYYGVCSNISEIAEIIHRHGKLLIVDEAHGPHLSFNRRLPAGALQDGADICVQSAHKTLPALTQGAYLHVGSENVDLDRIKYFLDIYQTTSPSYIIMAFLDIARELMQRHGEQLLNSLLDNIEKGAAGLEENGIRLLCRRYLNGFDHDTTRIVVNVAEMGITGFAAEKLLREKFNIQVEMSDLNNIVCIATVADDAENINRLFSSLTTLKSMSQPVGRKRIFPVLGRLKLPSIAMKPDELLNADFKKIPLSYAAGEISREMVFPYPPGIALICPGEIIDGQTVEQLEEIIRCGGTVHGIDENGCITVVD